MDNKTFTVIAMLVLLIIDVAGIFLSDSLKNKLTYFGTGALFFLFDIAVALIN